jgi:AraC-like DNA-binding protein
LPANQSHSYGAGPDDPWTIVWVHFTGEETAAWREFLGLAAPRGGLLALPDDRLDEIGFDQIYAALERGFAASHLVAAAAALRHSLCQVRKIGGLPRETRSAGERVAASIEMLRSDWQRSRRLEELATAANVSATHYSLLFRRQTGFSPIDYLIRLRVRHACHVLDTTQRSIAEVAASVGYDDAYYFTRLFRRVMGCSPRAYRMPKG